MFFGKILTGGQTYKFSTQQADQNQGQVLSITNVVLGASSKESVSLWAKKDEQEVLVAVLTKQHPHAAVNLFVSLLDEVTFIAKGNGAVYISGFFEPDEVEPIPDDEQQRDGKEGNVTATRPQTAKGEGKSGEAEEDDDDEQDEDFDVEEDIDEDEDDEDDDDDEDEDDEQEQEQKEATKVKHQQNLSKPQQNQQNQQNKPFGKPQQSKNWNNHSNNQGKNQGNNNKPFKKNKHFNKNKGKPFPKN